MKNSVYFFVFGCALASVGCGQSGSDAPGAAGSSASIPVLPNNSAQGTNSAPIAPANPAQTAPSAGSVPNQAPPALGAAGGASTPQGTVRATGAAGAQGSSVAAPGQSAAGSPAVSAPDAMGAAGAAASADPPGTVTLTTDTFLLKADQEIYKCQNFDNPFKGKDTAVQRVATDMSPGSHHLHVYHLTTSATRTLEDCNISDFHPLLFAAAKPHSEQQYPAGMAAQLLGKNGIRIQLHYINTSGRDLMVNATLKLTPVDYASVTKWVSELYFNQLAVQVPPGPGHSITTTCAIPQKYGPIGLVSGGTHMHKRGVHFVASTSTGKQLADVTSWDDPPPIVYDPPIMLNPGDKITWTCTYDNETSGTITFGESAETNEMCIYLARFFSAPDGAQLECLASGPMGMTSTRTY